MEINFFLVIRQNGLLVLGPRGDSYFDDTVESLSKNASEFQLFSPEELATEYPNLTMGPNVWGCLDPMGGIIMADKALKTVWSSFEKHGGQIIDNAPVKEISVQNSSCVKIRLKDGTTLESKSVVVCAGPWTNKLMEPLGYKIEL